MDSNHDKVIQSHLSLACIGSRPVRPEDDKRASDDRQVTKRSAESVPPEPRGLRGRGGERPSRTVNPRGARLNRGKRGSEMNPEDFRRSESGMFSFLAMTVIDSFLIGNSSRELLVFHEQID